MKRKVKALVPLYVLFMVLLVGCTLYAQRLGVSENTMDMETMANARLEDILNAISMQDVDAIVDLFASKVQENVSDLQNDAELLSGLLDGAVDSWTWTQIGANISEEQTDGKVHKKTTFRFDVTTATQHFVFDIREVLQDPDIPGNIGLQRIKVYRADDKEPRCEEDAGIFVFE